MSLSNQNNQSDGEDLSAEAAELYANELIEYFASIQQSVDMMIATGSDIDDLDFIIPSNATFNTPPHIHKVFHPQGGGFNYQETFNEQIQNGVGSIWAVNNNINVEWTDSTNNDVIVTAYFIGREICERINLKITGTIAIPATLSPHADYFLSTGTTDLDATECPGCEGHGMLCVENNTSDNYSFYSVIAAQ